MTGSYRARFAELMLAMSLSLKLYGRELSKEMQDAYWAALRDMSDAEFERAAMVLLRRETEFPPPSLFLEVARPVDSADAHRAMIRAWNAGRQIIPGEGSWWSGEAIRAAEGEAAYQAFHACGGSAAFRDMDDPFHGPRIRREWAECWQQQVRDEPAKALPAPRPVALPAAPEERVTIPPGTDPCGDALRTALRADRASRILEFKRPEPAPCPPETATAFARLGEKIAAKRAQLAAQTQTQGDR